MKAWPRRADLGALVADRDALAVIAGAPLPGRAEQVADRPRDEDAAAVPGKHRRESDAEPDQRDAAAGRAVDRRDRLRLGLAGAEEQIIRRQLCRHIAEDPLDAVNSLCLLPAGGIAVHDFGMPLAHVLADEGIAVRQPRDDVAEPVGDQDRCGRRKAALLQVLGKPFEIEAGEDDTGQDRPCRRTAVRNESA